MNFNFLKLKLPALPRNYWNGFLWSLILFLLAVLIFDAWVFWRFSLEEPKASAVESGETVRTDILERSLERLEKKAANFEYYKRNVPVEDPS